MSKIVPVASGKGGVGKTITIANLGILLAAKKQNVIIVDLDLGGSNLHTVLGIRNDLKGIGHFISRKDVAFEEIIHPTQYENLRFIPGDALFIGAANLHFFRKKQIMRELTKLEADWILLDLGAGSSNNTLDFYTLSSVGIMVALPELTSVLNLYSFLKNAYFRFLFQSFKKGEIIKERLLEASNFRLEKDDFRLIEYIRVLTMDHPEYAEEIEQATKDFYPKLILNMGESKTDVAIGENLRGIVHKNLGFELEYLGALPYEQNMEYYLNSRQPIAEARPQNKWVEALEVIAQRLINYANFPEAVFKEDSYTIILNDLEEQL